MKTLLLLILLVGCGKQITTGTIEDTPKQSTTSSQFAQCTAPRNPEIIYMGVPCRFQGMNGQNYLYICANNRNLIMDCTGRIL